jgi:hypothetical protein
MWTGRDLIELKELRREFEEASLMADAFPKNKEFRIRADSFELLIHSKEIDNRYI